MDVKQNLKLSLSNGRLRRTFISWQRGKTIWFNLYFQPYLPLCSEILLKLSLPRITLSIILHTLCFPPSFVLLHVFLLIGKHFRPFLCPFLFQILLIPIRIVWNGENIGIGVRRPISVTLHAFRPWDNYLSFLWLYLNREIIISFMPVSDS